MAPQITMLKRDHFPPAASLALTPHGNTSVDPATSTSFYCFQLVASTIPSHYKGVGTIFAPMHQSPSILPSSLSLPFPSLPLLEIIPLLSYGSFVQLGQTFPLVLSPHMSQRRSAILLWLLVARHWFLLGPARLSNLSSTMK